MLDIVIALEQKEKKQEQIWDKDRLYDCLHWESKGIYKPCSQIVLITII